VSRNSLQESSAKLAPRVSCRCLPGCFDVQTYGHTGASCDWCSSLHICCSVPFLHWRFCSNSLVCRLLRFLLRYWTHRRLTTRFSMCKALDCHTKIPHKWTPALHATGYLLLAVTCARASSFTFSNVLVGEIRIASWTHRRLTTRSSMRKFLGCHTKIPKIPHMWTHRRFTRLLFHIAHLLLAVTSARAFLFKSHVYRLLRFALHHWTHRRLTTRSLGCKANPKHRRLTTRFSMCKALDCHTKIPDMWTHRRFMRLVFLVAHLLFAVIGIFVHILTCTGC